MKNLFELATKELSQDAFLRWLFENYDSDTPPCAGGSLYFTAAFRRDASSRSVSAYVYCPDMTTPPAVASILQQEVFFTAFCTLLRMSVRRRCRRSSWWTAPPPCRRR